MSPTPDPLSGHLGHLTHDQEAKLIELWIILLTAVTTVLSAVYEVPIPEGSSSKLFAALDNINEPTVEAIISALKGEVANGETSNGTAPAESNNETNGETAALNRSDNKEQKSLDKVDALMNGHAKNTIISEMANRKVTPAHFSSLFSQLRELGMQDAEIKSMESILSRMTPQEMCFAILKMIKQENPDSLLLRFLRARKWDVGKAFSMMASNILWRKEVEVDEEILPRGEEYALEQSRSTKATPKEKKEGADFINQFKTGKSFLHGFDRDGRPVIYVRVKIHKPGAQSEEALERYIVHVIEATRLILDAPVETGVCSTGMLGY